MERAPSGWYLIKVANYTAQTLLEMDDWLAEQCQHRYERVGWRSGCAYMVGVQFADGVEAVHFRLRWSIPV